MHLFATTTPEQVLALGKNTAFAETDQDERLENIRVHDRPERRAKKKKSVLPQEQ